MSKSLISTPQIVPYPYVG